MKHSQMAKRTRVPARRSPNQKTARKAHKGAQQAQPPQPAIRAAPRWRPPGVAIEYTPELLENVRHRFEETDEVLASIAADMGIHPRTLSRLVLRKGWKRRRQPRDLSLAAKLLMQAERLQSGKEEPPAQFLENNERPVAADAESAPAGEEALPPVPETVDRLHRVVLKELTAVESRRTKLGREWESPVDAERTARTLGKLTETLQKILSMHGNATQAGSHDDDIPTDINEFRRELAHRINAFVESRTGGGDAGASGAPPMDVPPRE